mgnify:CR=1 FL=1
MNDGSRAGLDTETPVNPYSLLEAVNRSSDTANTAWLLFIGLLAFVIVVVGALTFLPALAVGPVAEATANTLN